MRSEVVALSDSIHASSEKIVSALERARDRLHGDELTEVLATAISDRGQIDATINRIIGGSDDVACEEALHRRRHLDITQAPNGGYVLSGFLAPKAGATLKRALEVVIEQQDADSVAARQRPQSSRQPRARPSTSASTARVSGTQARAAQAGRNDACPCGSGRKYKHCCGG
jgi:hypothetical protein